ncbi:hypothetical protein EDD21DRAFT_380197 [Dissophora ornata]|nr:hypothetical protein EDD21DRAFT_380197 [Dissophora ornata]
MTDSTPQPDYYLHLDLAEGEMEPQSHTDGGVAFLDFSESGQGETTTHTIPEQDPAQWQTGEVKSTLNSGATSVEVSSLEANTAGGFDGLLGAQVSIDTTAVDWNAAHQAYGSLIAMELNKQLSPPEQASGCITPDLIFPSGGIQNSMPDTESNGSEAAMGAPLKAPGVPKMPPPRMASLSGKQAPSGVVKSAVSVPPVATAPPKDIRRSSRNRRQSSLAVQSEEYLQSAQGTTVSVATAPVERVTRSKKVYCYCQKPDDGEVMIQCDNCRQWFHGACVDITDEIAELMELKNEKFFCDPCTEKLKVRAKNNLGVQGQKSSKLSDARDCALPTCLNEARATSDFCSEECAIKGIELEASQAVMNKDHRPAAIVIPPVRAVASSARKLSSPAQPSSPVTPKSPGSPKAEQNPVRATALKGLAESLMVAFDTKSEQKEADIEQASKLAALIEKELYMFTATPGQSGCGKDYKAKYRSLFFNLKDKNNEGLRARVLSGELEPHELVRLTPEELANPELQSIAEEVRKRSIHDSVLTIEQEPFIKKTHKGDVSFIPGPSMKSESSGSSSDDKTDNKNDKDLESKADVAKDAPEDKPAENILQVPQSSSTPTGTPATEALDKLLARIQTNKRSGEEILNDALSSEKRQKVVNTGQDGQAGGSTSSSYLPREPSPYSPSPSPSGTPALKSTTPPDSPPPFMLEEIERSLKKKTASARREALPVWQGTLYMHQVAKFLAKAIQVGGNRIISGRQTTDPFAEMIAPGWTDIMTKAVSIDGRIATSAVESYVTQQRQSPTKEVLVVQFEIDDKDASSASFEKRKGEFETLFRYFYQKSRNGVVPHKGRLVKDLYVVPVGAKDALPGYLHGLVEERALTRGADQTRKDALFGVLVVNKASSHHRDHQPQPHHGHSPSHSRASPSHSRQSNVSASRPYPTHHERHDSRESQTSGYVPAIHSPRQQAPGVSSPFSIGTPMTVAAAAAPMPNLTSSAPTPVPASAAPIKVPTLQELQGLVNQLFPSGNPSVTATSSSSGTGLTPAAAAVTQQLSSANASSLIAGLPANLTMNLTQTMAQFNQHQQQQQQQQNQNQQQPPLQQQQQQQQQHQAYFARAPPPGLPMPQQPSMPFAPPPGFPPLPPHLMPQQGRPPMPPMPPMPPIPPHQLQAFLAQHQQLQQPPFAPGFRPPPPQPPQPPQLPPQHQQYPHQQQGYSPQHPQGQYRPDDPRQTRPDNARRRDWS